MAADDERHNEELQQLVTFRLGDDEFGIEILKVQEIIRSMDITKVPRAPDFVEGVINLRGKVIPIIDLRGRFNLPRKPQDEHTRIINCMINNILVGIVVDAVSEVLRISTNTISPPPPVIAGVDADYVSGVGRLQNRLLIILDLDKMLTTEDIAQLGAM